MNKVILLSVIMLVGCTSSYDYKPGTKASMENYQRDHQICEDAALDKYGSERKITSSDIGDDLMFGIIGSAIVGSGDENGPDKKIIQPMIKKCMASKGYIEKS